MSDPKKKRLFVHYFPMYGCISTGMIYVAIGIIAILSFLKLKDGGADESSLLAFLNNFLIGKVIIWIILLGTISYIVWRIYESITDPYDYGKDVKGLAKRTGIALSTIADALIAFSAIQVLLGTTEVQVNGQPDELRGMVDSVLQSGGGDWLIIIIGLIVLVTAAVQLLYGVTRGYKERIDIDHFNNVIRNIIHWLARAGYVTRGVILGIIGFFFIKAGVSENAHYVVNTDKAFDFIGDDVGHVFFILTAVGTICYGLFMFALGATYDTDKD